MNGSMDDASCFPISGHLVREFVLLALHLHGSTVKNFKITVSGHLLQVILWLNGLITIYGHGLFAPRLEFYDSTCYGG